MTNKAPTPFARATCASIDLPVEGVPEWVHLLPTSNGGVRTHDGRGPYRVADPAAIIAASLNADPRDKGGLIIDENHATDHAAPIGLPSPARGRIVDMEARTDGIWGKVEWTPTGQALMADRAYRGISPVITYDKTGTVHSILRAGLVNYPNLRGLIALNSEVQMDLTELAKALGLAETATMAEIMAAVTELKMGGKGGEAELTAAQAQQFTAMQTEMATMTAAHASLMASHTALQTQIKLEKAEAFVDGAIGEARPGIKPRRDYWIAQHMENPAETEATILAISPWVSERRVQPVHIPATGEGAGDLTALNAEQQGRVLHDRAVALQAQEKTKGNDISLFDAITRVKKDVTL